MTLVTVEIEGLSAATALFGRKAEHAGRFMLEGGREFLRVVKGGIADEVQGQFSLADGRAPWEEAKQIGTLPAGRPVLQFLGRAWAAAPPQVSADRAELEITEPGASAHAGGAGTKRSNRVTFITSPGGSAQAPIFFKTGALVSRALLATRGVRLPSRPHANPNNPETAAGIERVLERNFEKA